MGATRRGAGRADRSQHLRLKSVAATTSPDNGQITTFTVAGLFAGIGGIELGLDRAGHQTRFLCEVDPSARAVLDTHFPGIPKHDDIRALPSLPAGIDLLTAGFPCQDLSQAGMTAGIGGCRSGLIGEVFRLIEARRVPWILLENVPFMLHLSGGRALEVIIGNLERLGYRWAYRVVDSLAFGVPQRRERVFLVATTSDDPRRVLLSDDSEGQKVRSPTPSLAFGFYWTEGTRGLGAAVDAIPTLKGGSTIGIPSPPAALLPNGDVVTPRIEDAERLQGFDEGWTKSAEGAGRRSHRWKLVGNAVTVDVAHWIGNRLREPGEYDSSWDARLKLGSRWPRAAWSMGAGRFASQVSTWPVTRPHMPLHEFLTDPRPLSSKATAGFWKRLQRSSLRRPEWFDRALKVYLARVLNDLPSRARRRTVCQDSTDLLSDGSGKVGEATAPA